MYEHQISNRTLVPSEALPKIWLKIFKKFLILCLRKLKFLKFKIKNARPTRLNWSRQRKENLFSKSPLFKPLVYLNQVVIIFNLASCSANCDVTMFSRSLSDIGTPNETIFDVVIIVKFYRFTVVIFCNHSRAI